MANTIESTTDEALTRSILDGSIEGTFEDDTITGKLPQYKLFNCANLEKVILPNITSASQFLFAGCTNLKTVIIPKATAIGNSIFERCINLTTVDLSGVVSLKDGQSSLVDSNQCNNLFSGCISLKTVKFDNLISVENATRFFRGYVETYVFPNLKKTEGSGWIPCEVTKKIDFGAVESFTSYSSDPFFGSYNNKPVTEAIIIRSNSVPTLSSTQSLHRFWANDSTASGQTNYNYTYRFYVPQALISEYQNATNWSNYSTFFEPIEGSIYEHYWADGTPLYMSNTSGLIAYYDVGNADDWDSETKTIASHVENDFNAWRQTSNNQFNINNAADIPTNIYDNCYMSGGFIINFGDGTTSNISIEDKYDVITIEFLYASSSNGSININKALTNESIGTQIVGYVGGLGLTFKHVVLELSKTGTKLFVNKVQKRNTNDNNINRPIININNSNNCYIGHVSVWNRELTSEEITQHYDYYVANFHVGETAFDSNGNFIAGS